ncbi:helix-hairpin-helix domain-containing protein [Arenimonas sp.]|uniref:helix-hairpin-helix domain-containing protein n=1 Tax=Arenimonas sp. TaxID=1872635 RepID=UPI0039E4CB74
MPKAQVAAQARKLQDIPNIGPSIADDLCALGIHEPKQLIGKDPYALYDRMTEISGVAHDPCLCDCFISAVRFMEGAPPHPWWHYTGERKRDFAERSASSKQAR